jgi:hypothetical protein
VIVFQRHAGRSLLALTVAYAALMFAGGSRVVVAFSVPHDSAVAAAFVAKHSLSIRWGSFLEFVSAIPLGIFMAVCISRLRYPDIRNAGESIADRLRSFDMVPDQAGRRCGTGRGRGASIPRL